jgi:hypothetical protein
MIAKPTIEALDSRPGSQASYRALLVDQGARRIEDARNDQLPLRSCGGGFIFFCGHAFSPFSAVAANKRPCGRSSAPSSTRRFRSRPQYPAAEPQPARPPLRLAAARDQTCALQHLQVPRHRRQADVERPRQLLHRSLAGREARQNGATRRIGQGRESEAERIG